MMPIQFIGPALRLVFLIEKRINEVLKGVFTIGLSAFKILFLLRGNHAISQNNIAKSWGMTEAAVSRQIQILLKHRYIQPVKTAARGRSKSYELSASGKSITNKAHTTIDVELNSVFGKMTTADRKRFAQCMMQAISCMKDAGLADDPFLSQKKFITKK
jgi:DNA-binding MarR family transcriptional regulator